MLNNSPRFVNKNSLTWWYVLKTSWRYFCKKSWRCLGDDLNMSSEDVLNTFLQDVFKTFWRRLKDVFARRLENVLKTSWKRLEDVLKTYGKDKYIDLDQTSKDVWLWRIYLSWSRRLEDVLKASSEDEDERRLQYVFKTSSSRRMFSGILLWRRLNFGSFF